MIKKVSFFFFAVLFIVLTSCDNSSDKNIKVIEEAEMIELLADLHFIDVAGKQSVIPLNSNNYTKQKEMLYVLKERGVSKSFFDASLKYYAANPKLFNEMYEQVINRLNERQAGVEQQKVKAINAEQDSIKLQKK